MYGEKDAEVAEDVFCFGVKFQINFQEAERRACKILEQDNLDLCRVREYLESLYDQCKSGVIECSGLVWGRDSSGRRYTNEDLQDVLNSLPNLNDVAPNTNKQPKHSLMSKLLGQLSKYKPRFIYF